VAKETFRAFATVSFDSSIRLMTLVGLSRRQAVERVRRVNLQEKRRLFPAPGQGLEIAIDPGGVFERSA
jgi:hypothetical protein